MKVLVIGGGGREHCLVWKIGQSSRVSSIYCAPGNAGISQIAECVDIRASDIEGIIKFAKDKSIDLTLVGPEVPLVEGIVDRFQGEGLRIFGPSKRAAMIEGSKVWAKELMRKYGIPTADYRIFSSPEEAKKYIEDRDDPVVVKVDGLAAGKGAIVAHNKDIALEAIDRIMVDRAFGRAGDRVVVEELLKGEEASVLAFTDGSSILPMIAAQDHKQVFAGDRGPNTGGMGAYAPAPLVTEELHYQIACDILLPIIKALASEGAPYKGVLYTGLMIKDGKAKVLEFNARFGDPETQVILPLLNNDLIDIIEAIEKERLEEIKLDWKDKKAICVVLASGGYPGDYVKGKVINGLDRFTDEVLIFHAGTAFKNRGGDSSLSKGGDIITAGGRVLDVVALGDSYQKAMERVYENVAKIDFEDVYYRKDIGAKALRYR